MAKFQIRGKERHLGMEVLHFIERHFEGGGNIPHDQRPGMVLYGFSVLAEMLRQPEGLFAGAEVVPLVGDLPGAPDERLTLRQQIIGHLKDNGLARPALSIQHCRTAGAEVLHGAFKTKVVPLEFLGPVNLAAVTGGALIELGKAPDDRIKVFCGSDQTRVRPLWEKLHQRHLALVEAQRSKKSGAPQLAMA